MKFLIVGVALLAVSCSGLPQNRRVQPKGFNQQPQQSNYDQQQQQSQDNFRQPINVADYNSAQQHQQDYKQQEYKQQEYKQPEYRHNTINNYEKQDFKGRSHEETTTWIPIIKFSKEQETDGSYKTAYETGNNIIAEETGFLNNIESENPSLVQHGSYTYISPEGKTITVQYTADEFGFRAVGEHIPTPPPVSPEIQKGLDLIYAGIKANEERLANEQKANPEAFAKKQADKAALDFLGHYYPQ